MRQIRFFLGFAALAVMFFISCSDPVGPDPPRDTTPPKVIKTVPPDSFVTTETEFNPVVIFSEPVRLGKDPVNVVQDNISPKVNFSVSGKYTLSESRDSLFFNPGTPFTPGNKYVMKLSGIKDDAGNVMPDYAFCWFVVASSVADTISPEIISSTPPDGATGVAVGITISDEFSEDLDPATVNSQSYQLLKDGAQVPATVSYSNRKATLVPNSDLEYETTYEVVLTSAITDTAGNSLVEITRKFTTEIDPTPRWYVGDNYKPRSLDYDAQGNFYVVGTKVGYASDDAGFVAKFNSQGKRLWIKEYVSDKYDMVWDVAVGDNFVYAFRNEDPNGTGGGNLYIEKITLFGDSVDTFPISGTYMPIDIDVYNYYIYCIAAGSSDHYVFKISADNGTLLKRVSKSGASSIVSNNYGVFLGISKGFGSNDIYLEFLDYDLSEHWVRRYDSGKDDQGAWISVISSNSIYISSASGDFSSGVFSPTVVKFDFNGDLIWDSTYVNVNNINGTLRRVISTDQQGNIFMGSGPIKFSSIGKILWHHDIDLWDIKFFNGVVYGTEYKKGGYILLFDAQTGAEIK